MVRDLDSDVAEFVAVVGSGGCISGNAEVLKEHIPDVRIIAAEPYYVRNISGGDTSGKHRLEGIGLSFTPSILRKDLIEDEVIAVKDEDAYQMANDLARKEGIFGGITSGANVWAALEVAVKAGKGKTIVTFLPDTGERYLSTSLFEK